MPSVLVEPAYAKFPTWKATLGPEVCDIATLAGLPPDPEQQLALDALFALDPVRRTRDGLPASASFEFAVICARQNLKTALFKMAALGWLFVTDQQLIVWSAHELDTTKEAFRDLTNLIENCPPLAKRLAPGPTDGILSGNGSWMIELAPSEACPNGQRLKFKARTKGGGRGLTGDRVVLDEAYALQPSHMGSLMPTLSAVADPQLVYGSSAGHADSEVLRKIRDRGRVGASPRLGYLEFCAPDDICEQPDCSHEVGEVSGCALDNMEYIRMANPALERRITVEYILDERQALPANEFARERLGWWDKPAIEDGPLISKDMWKACLDADSVPTERVAFGVYVNKLQTSAAIGVAGRREDGKIHVGIVPAVRGGQVASLPGIGWIPARLKELRDSWTPCGWGIDDRSAAGSLLSDIEKQGVAVENATAADVARACGTFYTKVRENGLRHRGSKPLTDSVTAGKMRDLADAWAWDRKDIKSDIVQLMAVTLAVHGLETAPPPTDVWSFYS